MPSKAWSLVRGYIKEGCRIPLPVGICLLLILSLGIVLRVAQFGHNREFWEDEAIVANEIMQKSPIELTGVLNYTMNYPVGFLLSEKLAVTLFGNTEYAFRLFPLLAGLLSVLLFVLLARDFALRNETDPLDGVVPNPSTRNCWGAVLVSSLCFSANKHLIYYSSELRQYSFELLMACALYVLAGVSSIAARSDRESYWRILALSMFAGFAVWLSLTAVYLLAAIALVQAWAFYTYGKWKSLRLLIAGSTLWGVSFLLHYGLIKSHIAAQGMAENLRRYSAYVSPPLPPTSLAELRTLRESIEHVFYFPGAMTFIGLALFTYGVGCISLWKRNKELFFLMVLPIVFAALASALHQYPFRGRYLLFIMPSMCLILGEGIGLFLNQNSTNLRRAGYLLMAILLTQPLAHSIGVLIEPRTGPGGGSHTTRVLEYIQERWHEGDTIYVDSTQLSTFLFYKDRYQIRDDDYILNDSMPKFFALEEDPFTLPEPKRTPSGELRGSGRFWVMTIADVNPIALDSALDAAAVRREPLDVFKTRDGNTLGLYVWNP